MPAPSSTGVAILHQPNSYVNFDQAAGRRYDNSVVLAAINWKADQITEARLRVEQQQGEKWVDAGRGGVFGDVLSIFDEPNPWYGGSTLLRGLLLSWDVSGNAYAIKLDTNGGKPGGLLWYPPSNIRPASDSKGELVTHYEVRSVQSGAWRRMERSQVVHMRYGLDPENSRVGLSRLAAALREIATENEVASWLYSVLRNKAVPGMLVSPKTIEGRATPEQLKSTVSYLREFVRDRRGEPGMLPVPVDVMTPSWSPQELDLAAIRSMPITSICAALGVHPMVLNYESDAATFSNMAEAIDSAGKRTILPMLREWAAAWSAQILPDFGLSRGFRIAWDLSGVSWLQDEADGLHARVREDFRAGIIDRWRAKEMIGERPDPGDKGLTYFAMSAPVLPVVPKAWTKSPPKDSIAPDHQTKHDRLIAAFERNAAGHVADWAAGTIDGSGFEDAMLATISKYHANAYALGLDLAGAEGDGIAHGARMADLEAVYVRGFRDRLESGQRYFDDAGEIDLGSGLLANDLRLYASKAGGSANAGFVDGSDDSAEFDWLLGGAEEHCEDCPYIAEGSPYTKGTLYTKPRQGDTPCLSNCTCRLVRSDGVTGFEAPS